MAWVGMWEAKQNRDHCLYGGYLIAISYNIQ